MKKLLYILPFLILSCAKKEMKIPTLAEKGIQEVFDHSQVWFFFEVENNDTIAKLNRKNTISSTNWIFNIDKRLPLKTFITDIIKLQDKHANSIHSKEGMHNYFSFSDTISKTLSFLEFDNITYTQDSILSKYFIKENSNNYLNYNNISLIFNPENVWLNDSKIEKQELKETLLEFIDFSAEGKQTMLHLNFNENLLYQDYLAYKTMLFNLNNNAILTNTIEFIFNETKVPDCGCE
jgi:hypothetical protein